MKILRKILKKKNRKNFTCNRGLNATTLVEEDGLMAFDKVADIRSALLKLQTTYLPSSRSLRERGSRKSSCLTIIAPRASLTYKA